MSTVFTALIGATLSTHALVLLILALTESTATFLAVGRPIGWIVTGAGVAALLWYGSRLRTHTGVPTTPTRSLDELPG